MRAELLDRLATVAGLGDHSHVRLDADETGDALKHERMVVDRENPDGRAALAHGMSPLPRADVLEANSGESHKRLPDVA